MSLWVAAPVATAVASGWREGLLSWLALSALAIIIEQLLTSGRPPERAYWDSGESDAAERRGTEGEPAGP